MKYDPDKMLLSVSRINNNSLSKRTQIAISDKVKATVADRELSFKNSALPDVMEKLARYYNAKIQYDTASVEAMNFTELLPEMILCQ